MPSLELGSCCPGDNSSALVFVNKTDACTALHSYILLHDARNFPADTICFHFAKLREGEDTGKE